VKRQKQSAYKLPAIYLPTDRRTTFAMTILNLSLRAVQKARRGNLLAMTTCQQMAARHKASRHDNSYWFAMTTLHLPALLAANFLPEFPVITYSKRSEVMTNFFKIETKHQAF
jgi:hypothetical protein